jgi:hypothetical protein
MVKGKLETISVTNIQPNKNNVAGVVFEKLWSVVVSSNMGLEYCFEMGDPDYQVREIGLVCKALNIDIEPIRKQIESEPEFQLDTIRKEYEEKNKKTS